MMKGTFPALLLIALAWTLSFGEGGPGSAAQAELVKIKELAGNGDLSEAEKLARELLSRTENASGPTSLETAAVLDQLVDILINSGKTTETESIALAARAVEAKALNQGPDHLDLAVSLDNQGYMLQTRGEYEAAGRLLEKALAIREANLPANHPDIAWSLDSLASLLQLTGSFARSRELYERAVAVYEETLGPEHPDLANSLNNLALLLYQTGDYQSARPLYERVRAIDEQALGSGHPKVATCLNNLALLLQAIGDDEQARAYFGQVLDIREKTYGPEHHSVAQALSNLAFLLRDMGDHEGTRPLLERALAINEKTLGPEHPDVAACLAGLASLLDHQGDYAAARPLYERALAIRKKAFGPEHPLVAKTMVILGTLMSDMGETRKARPLIENALALQVKQLGSDHPEVARSLRGLAADAYRAGEYEEAFAQALAAAAIERKQRRLTTRTLPERQALRYAAVRTSSMDMVLSLGMDGKGKAAAFPKAWDALIRSRTLVLDEIAARNRKVAEASRIGRLARQFAEASQRYANLMMRGPGGNTPGQYQRLLEETRREKEDAERLMAESSESYLMQKRREDVGLEQVLEALPGKSALVAFARFERYPVATQSSLPGGEPAKAIERQPGTGKKGIPAKVEPVPSYLAIIHRKDKTGLATVPLGLAEEIEALVAAWMREAGRGMFVEERSAGQAEAAYREAGDALRARIWDPLANHLDGVERIFVVQDGPLHLVNLACLPVGEADYLLETGRIFHYMSAERDLVPSEGKALRGKGLLVLGGPAFDETSLFASLAKDAPALKKEKSARSLSSLLPFRRGLTACGALSLERFRPLPSTRREAEAITALWQAAVPGQTDPASVIRLEGATAGEEQFKSLAPGRRVLHLATHGFFLAGKCDVAPEGTRGVALPSRDRSTGPSPLAAQNPLLLSGLALAGANHRNAASMEEEDGILTAEEIAAMDLSGVDWAVLSACDTGVGEIRAGEGVFGLRRAFHVAGVGSLIMSLWGVDDAATQHWMKALYEARLVKRKDTAQAVHDASLTVLAERRSKGRSTHPFFWGAFVSAGNWK